MPSASHGAVRSSAGAVIACALFAASVVSGAPAMAASSTPDEWDPRVRELVDVVEDAKGAPFEHPVRVAFLGEKKFRAEVRTDDDDVSARDRREAGQLEGQLRALGLVAGEIDLIGESSDVNEDGTLGFYDTEKERMVVRGRDLDDVEVRSTIVHELTHAWQDQHHDLDALDRRAKTSGEVFALGAVVEGDATLVEQDWISTLSDEEQDAYWNGGGGDAAPDDAGAAPIAGPVEDDDAATAGAFAILSTLEGAPYRLGPEYLILADELAGRDVEEVFADLPRSEEEIIDPVAGQELDHPKRVQTPRPPEGARRHDDADVFGALTWYLVLAPRIGAPAALRAVEGWGGDRSQGYRLDDRECIGVNVVGDRAGDTDEWQSALERWTTTLPAGAASVARAGDVVRFDACEPEAAIVAPTAEELQDAVDHLSDRNALIRALGVDEGAVLSRCIADRLVDVDGLVDLVYADELSRADEDHLGAEIADAADACGR